MELYGFFSESELNCFQMLIGVSGVGAQGGPVHPVRRHAGVPGHEHHHRDEKALTVAQGIGKKIAQRIILELKDKLAKGQLSADGESYGGTGVTVIPENKSSEAAAALAVLGYSQSEIGVALKGIDVDALSLEDVIKQGAEKDGQELKGGRGMAKLERTLTGDFDALLDYLHDGILSGSASASWRTAATTAARFPLCGAGL